jgi:hypothetical protein
MLSVISSDTDDLGGLDGMNKCGFVEVDMFHAAAGKTLDVAITVVRRLGEKASDLLTSGDGLNEAVVDRAVKRESGIAHASVI